MENIIRTKIQKIYMMLFANELKWVLERAINFISHMKIFIKQKNIKKHITFSLS